MLALVGATAEDSGRSLLFATTECPEPTYSGGGVVMPTNCYYEFEVNKCEPYYTVSAMGMVCILSARHRLIAPH